MKANIPFDESGELRSDAFYEFHVMFDDEPPDQSGQDRTWIVIPRVPTDDALSLAGRATYCYVEALPQPEDRVEEHGCPTSSKHVTRRYCKNIPVDVYGDSRLAEFVPDSNLEVIFLSPAFAEQVRKLSIVGINLRAGSIKVNQSAIKVPKFSVLQFMGRDCSRIRNVQHAPNACPFCEYAPMICQECGEWPSRCPQCEEDWFVAAKAHKGPGDKRLTTGGDAEAFARGHILEGKRWDGADVLNCRGWNFISKRFLDWLLMVHAAPFYVKPARFCIDGMTEMQLTRLKEVQQPLA